jgi:hypothetical protein
MAHVISTSKPKPRREPAVHVNTPMDLFSHNQVDSPTLSLLLPVANLHHYSTVCVTAAELLAMFESP